MKKLIIAITLAVVLPLQFYRAAAAETGVKLMKIKLTVNDAVLTGFLNDSSTSEDLYDKLPIRLTMYPHENREVYGEIHLAKTTNTQNGYRIGDISYWTPGNALVVFYGKGYTGSLIPMGRITSGLDKLTEINNSFSVLIERNEE